MAYCGKCGNQIKDGYLYCNVCGEKAPETDGADDFGSYEAKDEKVYEATPEGNSGNEPVHSKKDRFAKIGYYLSLAGLICSFIPFVNLYTIYLCIVGLVFGIISGTSPNSSVRDQSRKAKIMGIIGIALSITIFVLFYILVIWFWIFAENKMLHGITYV